MTLIVRDYDEAIRFFVDALGFELVEDSPSVTNDGRPKRWVVVRPPDAATGLLLAQADDDGQQSVIGAQFAGRVGLFLRVDDFDAARQRMLDHATPALERRTIHRERSVPMCHTLTAAIACRSPSRPHQSRAPKRSENLRVGTQQW